MGAVQSGKTASMLAVIAKSLDAGVDGVVVLGGTRTALWLQTWERLLDQLDTLEAKNRRSGHAPSNRPDRYRQRRCGDKPLRPQPEPSHSSPRPESSDHRCRYEAGCPPGASGRTMREVVYPAVQSAGRPFHLLVVDDEADDSSIDERRPRGGGQLQERQVPRRIVDLWESRQFPGETAIPEFRVTYLAYTATPQANFLQDQSQPARAN